MYAKFTLFSLILQLRTRVWHRLCTHKTRARKIICALCEKETEKEREREDCTQYISNCHVLDMTRHQGVQNNKNQ